jgi:aminoglycoside phosphotransferase (APT) family kinase protein
MAAVTGGETSTSTEQPPDRTELDGLVDVDALERWIGDRLPGDGPFAVRRISTGASNEIFELERADEKWVLRRPPRSRTGTQDILLREYRLLRALEPTDVPHPRAVLCCDDEAIIGAYFYVMEHIDGFTPTLELPPPFDVDVAARRGLGLELVDALASLARVDWLGVGLEDFGRPDGFLERQVSRWLGFDAGSRVRTLDQLDGVASWLDAARPPAVRPAVMHGDYQFANVMFRPDVPARVAAIVDWEQSTVGDPLVDLGWMLALWDEPGEEPIRGQGEERVSALDGFPTRAELAERYAQRTGLDLEHLGWYEVFALFKLAMVLESSYTRYATGRSDNPAHVRLERMVPELVASAARLVAAGGRAR